MFEVAFQQGRELLERQPLSVFAFLRSLHDAQHHLVESVEALVLQVVCGERTLLVLREPVALTIGYLLFQLGIELVVIDGCVEVDVAIDAHTDETARAGGIDEWHRLVGGADERGIATAHGVGLAVGWAIAQIGDSADRLSIRGISALFAGVVLSCQTHRG